MGWVSRCPVVVKWNIILVRLPLDGRSEVETSLDELAKLSRQSLSRIAGYIESYLPTKTILFPFVASPCPI